MPHDNKTPNERTKAKKAQRKRQLEWARATQKENDWLRQRLKSARGALRYERKALRDLLAAMGTDAPSITLTQARDHAKAAIAIATREIDALQRDAERAQARAARKAAGKSAHDADVAGELEAV